MAGKALGPTFADECVMAGLSGFGEAVSWGATDDTITGRENLNATQNAILDQVIADHDPTKKKVNQNLGLMPF